MFSRVSFLLKRVRIRYLIISSALSSFMILYLVLPYLQGRVSFGEYLMLIYSPKNNSIYQIIASSIPYLIAVTTIYLFDTSNFSDEFLLSRGVRRNSLVSSKLVAIFACMLIQLLTESLIYLVFSTRFISGQSASSNIIPAITSVLLRLVLVTSVPLLNMSVKMPYVSFCICTIITYLYILFSGVCIEAITTIILLVLLFALLLTYYHLSLRRDY